MMKNQTLTKDVQEAKLMDAEISKTEAETEKVKAETKKRNWTQTWMSDSPRCAR